MTAPPPAPKPRRAAKKVGESPSYGFSKILVLRDGLELNDVQRIVGDELIVPCEQAERLAHNGAAEIIESGVIGNAAE